MSGRKTEESKRNQEEKPKRNREGKKRVSSVLVFLDI